MLLNTCTSPEKIKALNTKQLQQLAEEIRQLIISNAEENGGHLGGALGVVEITIALHYIFNSPKDKIIWDIGHQAHAHKILTSRKDALATMRKEGGLSGFCCRKESPHDVFGAGHSSTSIAAAVGIAVAQTLKGNQSSNSTNSTNGTNGRHSPHGKNAASTKAATTQAEETTSNTEAGEVIAVIGDGALAAGMAIEGLSSGGFLNQRSFVIVNDNEMSISPSVGGISQHLKNIKANGTQLTEANLKDAVKNAFKKDGQHSNIFTNCGCGYIGVVDGHSISLLTKLLALLKNSKHTGTIVVHVATEKGRGSSGAKLSHSKLHAITPRGASKIENAAQQHAEEKEAEEEVTGETMSQCFSQEIVKLMQEDEKVVCISAAMTIGTGLWQAQQIFPSRVFDVAIAEQFAVTFASAMATEGIKPYCCIYSTFLQRGYDQIIHDAAVQSLPIKFIIDRAGYVGEDGQTHHGAFDIAYLSIIPNIIIMSPSSGEELKQMLHLANSINHFPCAIRYARNQSSAQINSPIIQATAKHPAGSSAKQMAIGSARTVIYGTNVCIIAVGNKVRTAVLAAEEITQKYGFTPTVIDLRFIKPIDKQIIAQVAFGQQAQMGQTAQQETENDKHKTKGQKQQAGHQPHRHIITVEDGSQGGVAALINAQLLKMGYKGKVTNLHHPDEFMPHATTAQQHKKANIDKAAIVSAATGGH